MKTKPELPEIKPDQTWASNKAGERDVRVKIADVGPEHAECYVWRQGRNAKAKRQRIRLSRFNSTATGFRLLSTKEDPK